MRDLEAFLDIFRCPDSGRPVDLADESLVEQLNAAISAGRLRDYSGTPVDEPIEEALRPAGADYVFPVRGGIPSFILDTRLPLEALEAKAS